MKFSVRLKEERRRTASTDRPAKESKPAKIDKENPDTGKAERDANENVAQRAAAQLADTANLEKMHDQYYSLALGSLDRAKFAAETIQKASAAIASIYAGVLALVFSVTDNPLPLRGIIAPIFLGAAVILSSIYLTYIVPAPPLHPSYEEKVSAPQVKAYERLRTFIHDVTLTVNHQIGYLGAAVAALFVGLAAVTLPFLGIPAVFTDQSDRTSAEYTAISTPWPTLDPAGSSLPNELAVELYKQQLAEVSALRADEAALKRQEESAGYTLFLLVGGAVLTGLGGLLPFKGKPTADDAENRD